MKLIKNKGFSLIEVLVSVVILSVGLLSIAALQINAKKATYDSIQRTTASQLASDIIERMRANNSTKNSALEIYEVTLSDPITDTVVDCSKSVNNGACKTASVIALYDLSEWQEMLIEGLQSPTACISLNGNLYTVAIAWRGVENMTNSTVSDCGNDDAGVIYGDSNEYRRILTVDFFISTVSG